MTMGSKYGDVETMESLAFWLNECDGAYSLARFSSGIGLYGNKNGGCWGVLTPELLESMRGDGYLEESFGHIGVTPKFWGFARRHQYEKLKREFEPEPSREEGYDANGSPTTEQP
jgi:hypothetical protein